MNAWYEQQLRCASGLLTWQFKCGEEKPRCDRRCMSHVTAGYSAGDYGPNRRFERISRLPTVQREHPFLLPRFHILLAILISDAVFLAVLLCRAS